MSEESSEHQRSAWKADSLLGLRASREEIEKLRAVWPAAFPEKSHLVRPLALGLVLQPGFKVSLGMRRCRG
jgi:hypothetical protein